jgi:hypothetical protein
LSGKHHHQKDVAPAIHAARNAHRISAGRPFHAQMAAVINPKPMIQHAGKMVFVMKVNLDDRAMSAVIALMASLN